mmetsp:Transcript_42852/g.41172  ORF Transcript_42852/g.41172 Transcript_42852/m.41172 type:complete len:80 (-) Transcript_42852:47-286(-)
MVSCGSAHMLALTDEYEMYSWGCGNYGALGFGVRNDIKIPTKLQIIQANEVQLINGIACGKYHSLCISTKKKLFAWGSG